MLTVGDTPGFAEREGWVSFYRDEDNVRFEINREALRGQKLEASSKLLALATLVGGI